MVSDLASMGLDIKRASLRSAGSLPEGIVDGKLTDRDDVSLYGTPKEEIPPYLDSR